MKTMSIDWAMGAVVLALAGPAAAQQMDAKQAETLMAKAGCNACHALDKKGVGPSYKEVAAKRKGDPKAADTLVQKVRAGGAGVYGQVPMPPHPPAKIGDDDLKGLVGWILTL
jgi:cytochrome c